MVIVPVEEVRLVIVPEADIRSDIVPDAAKRLVLELLEEIRLVIDPF